MVLLWCIHQVFKNLTILITLIGITSYACIWCTICTGMKKRNKNWEEITKLIRNRKNVLRFYGYCCMDGWLDGWMVKWNETIMVGCLWICMPLVMVLVVLSIFNDNGFTSSFLFFDDRINFKVIKKQLELALEWCRVDIKPKPKPYEILAWAHEHTHTHTDRPTGIKFETNNKFRLEEFKRRKNH